MKPTTEELAEILAAHAEWVSRGRTGDGRAVLRYADLLGADLRDADLCYADLTGADLRGADLEDASLRDADLEDASLRYAVLRYADLRGADLRYADLCYADLTSADLRDADLFYADLDGADLTGATGGPRNASVQWARHGESGRRLSAYRHSDGTDRYTCGFVAGVTLDWMREWIESHDESFSPSRLRALRIVAELMEE